MEISLLMILMIVAFGLFVTVDAQGPAGLCVPAVRVRKNTVYRGSSKSLLRVPCPVTYCEEIPTVRWFRIKDTDKSIPVSETDQVTVTQEWFTAEEKEIISYLSFKSLSVQDDGLYRCAAAGSNSASESHNIKVSVSDTILDTVNGKVMFLPVTASPTVPVINTAAAWMPYIIICSGVFCLVTIVMLIVLLSLYGCTCSRKPVKHTDQYTTAVFTPVETSPTISEHTEDISV
ncbi:B- and T-lymphocyte attenuator-like [Colossoma macropomum]|uniref:B- and T-lymphocyte attenuator-like n=1 Tax=Colossoma macropomum TaxID=42526 RepID=UPI001864FC1F|nr:B- and T-lymphocyte attenuator-like [Colossoma macropomum]